jgi:hypothetical protein
LSPVTEKKIGAQSGLVTFSGHPAPSGEEGFEVCLFSAVLFYGQDN